jgi:hypothetical protein
LKTIKAARPSGLAALVFSLSLGEGRVRVLVRCSFNPSSQPFSQMEKGDQIGFALQLNFRNHEVKR